VMQVPEEEKYLNSKKELEARIIVALGGRAAEEIIFGDVTTGASNDIEQATKICRAMITQYGMSDKFGLMGLAEVESQYLSGKAYMNCGDETATEIDHEIMKMLAAAYEEAKRLLNENRDVLDRIANYLIVQETITGKEFMQIMNTVLSEREQAAAEAAAPAAEASAQAAAEVTVPAAETAEAAVPAEMTAPAAEETPAPVTGIRPEDVPQSPEFPE